MYRLFLFVLLVTVMGFSQDKRNNIAVNDLVGEGVDQTTAMTISERLRVELINTHAFKVMERSQMDKILQEQGFQQTGCTDNSCIVKIGQFLGVENMVIGVIGKVGSMYTISLRMVNVATGEVLYTASEDCRCEIEDVLTTSTPNIAKKLQGAVEKAVFGTLTIKTVPDSATVLINNNKIGFTSYSNDRFIPGKYSLTLRKPTYEPIAQEIEIELNKTVDLSFNLEHTKVFFDSIKTAIKQKHLHKLLVRQLIWGCLAAGVGGAGYYFNNQANNNITKENEAKANYQSAKPGADFNGLYNSYVTASNNVNNALLTRNILYGVSGALALCFVISFAF